MTQTVQWEPGAQRGWIRLIVAGFAVQIIGIIVGLQKAGPLCGSPLMPGSRSAEIFDSLRHGSGAAAECYRNIASAEGPTWILIGLGIVVVLAAVTHPGRQYQPLRSRYRRPAHGVEDYRLTGALTASSGLSEDPNSRRPRNG